MRLTLALALAVQVLGTLATISPTLQRQFLSHDSLDVFVTLKDHIRPVLAELKTNTYANRGEKLTTVANTLKTHAAKSQASLLAFLSTHNVDVKSYWINNKVLIKGAWTELVELIAARADVIAVTENRTYGLIKPVENSEIASRPKFIEWGLNITETYLVWEAGYNGTGVRIAGLDTGVRHTHEALRDNFARDYNWFDSIGNTDTPTDPHGHGTHVTGTMAGSQNIGVAPGAEWVHCRGMNAQGSGTEQNFLDCAEWFSCPTLPNGQDPDCTKAPALVSNSWGLAGGGNDFMDDAILVWLAGDIVPIFANGNDGPDCGDLRSPGDSVVPVIAVGSTDEDDAISYFSSFGPSYAGQIKPDIVAPGSMVRSASNIADTRYAYKSGTSMATPHVAGVVALLLDRYPSLSFDEITERLYQGATQTVLQTGGNCGDIPESTFPNNHVGWGRLSAASTVL